MNSEKIYDAIVVGGGPAGLTAAIYLARARYRVLVLEKERFGGQITITSEVVNYPGVAKMSGAELTEQMRKQAENFGAEFMLAEALELDFTGDVKVVKTTKGDLQTLSILLATGAHPRQIGFPGEKEFQGRGVAYCATCDGEFFTGKEVFVVGGGFAAAEEAVFLTRYAKHVTILVREDDFTCAREVASKALNHEKITVHFNTEIVRLEGDSLLQKITYRNNVTDQETVFQPDDNDSFGVFVFAGYEPSTDLIKGVAELNSQGYVITDAGKKTTRDGLYAAGDVCIKSLRQVVTATGDGALAATEMERYISDQRTRTGLTPIFRGAKVDGGDPSKAGDGKALDSAGGEFSKTAGGNFSKGEGGNSSKGEGGNASKVEGGNFSKGEGGNASKAEGRSFSEAGGDDSPKETGTSAGAASDALLDREMKKQLEAVFSRLTQKLTLEIHLDDRSVSRDLAGYMNALAELTDKLEVKDASNPSDEGLPFVRVLREDDSHSGITFHGAPGGHEFTSFVLGLYNAGSVGQAVSEDVRHRIEGLNNSVHLTLLVSLSCTMCPELVTAAGRIATLNPNVTVDTYDLNHFGDLKAKYHVMSVPAFVMNDGKLNFGKKSVEELVSLIESA